MEYTTFSRLLKLKLDLTRDLHRAAPTDHGKLRRCVEVVSSRLQTDSDFHDNLRRFRHELGRIG